MSSAKAKWQNQGWELVSEKPGTLRTELYFRRVKPKTVGAYLLSFVAAFRRVQPKTGLVLIASIALMLAAGGIGIVIGTQSGADAPGPGEAQTTASTSPPAEPTVAGVNVDEPLDESDTPAATPTTTPTAAPTPSAAQRSRAARLRKEAAARERARERAESRAKARARARAKARALRRQKADQQVRRDNTAKLQSGITCDEIGQTDILVTPGVDIDRDNDGIGCES